MYLFPASLEDFCRTGRTIPCSVLSWHLAGKLISLIITLSVADMIWRASVCMCVREKIVATEKLRKCCAAKAVLGLLYCRPNVSVPCQTVMLHLHLMIWDWHYELLGAFKVTVSRSFLSLTFKFYVLNGPTPTHTPKPLTIAPAAHASSAFGPSVRGPLVA